jgi:protoporphyrinogen oxidase
MKQNYDIIIVGAGMAGLACAQKCNESNQDFLLIEKSDRIGGRVGSLKNDGFIFDIGFQVYNTAYEITNKLLRNKLDDFSPFLPGAKIISGKNSTIISDPMRNFSKVFHTIFSSAGSFKDKIKILTLKYQLSNYSIDFDENVDMSTVDFLKQYGFSDKIINNFFHPFFSGIFLEDKLDTSSKFFKYVFSNFNKGLAVIPKDGMQEIPDKIFSNARPDFLSNREVTKILPKNNLQLNNGDIISFKKLVLTNESCGLVNQYDVKFNSVTTVYVSTKLSFRDSTYIHLFPQDELINNVAFVSSVSPGYAPLNKTLISISIIVKGQQVELEQTIKQKMSAYFGGASSDYTIEKILKTKKATINQLPGFFQPKTSAIDSIILAGDHVTNGSIEGAVISGIKAYERTVK